MTLPDEVKPYFWSYDLNRLDLKKHKKLIIFQVLSYGSKKAINWLFSIYSKEEIQKIASTIPQGQWDKKSLNFWSMILGISPVSRYKSITHS